VAATATDSLVLLEQELTLLARHHLSNVQHAELALDRSGYQLLGRLELEPMSLGRLAEAFRLDVSTVNRQIAALREKGLVERIPDPEGGVARLVRPTRRGRDLLRADRRTRRGHLARVIEGWEDHDVAELNRLLTRLNTSIEELEGRPWPRS
jgi:DNA-binding MarR family transcriptional regulator